MIQASELSAKELRIGNFILAGIMTEPISVFTIEYKLRDGYLINKSIPISDAHPFPLTPSILIACGFDTDTVAYWIEYSIEGQIQYLELGHFKGDVFKHLPTRSLSTQGVIVKSLHQLQNLFFSLTNQELIYKS